MNGKIRVSIVATSLKGSTIYPDGRPVLNVVKGSTNRNNNISENLFSKNNIEQNVVNSIDGATALKLDETYEIKNNEEQNALIESFESDEENKIAEQTSAVSASPDEIPAGVSIESASYIESNNFQENDGGIQWTSKNEEEEYTPKLFSEGEDFQSEETSKETTEEENRESDQLFDQDINEEEDFEIPAFLRKQKF